MLNRIIDRVITKEETKLGVSLEYLRDIAGESQSAFFKLAMAVPLTRHRKVLPKAAHHLASILATQKEDCGECLEMAVQLALKAQVPSTYIRAALDGEFHLLPVPLEEVCAFTRAIIDGQDAAAERAAVRSRYGSKGIMEIGFIIGGARLFPSVKRVIGEVPQCSRPQLELA